MKRILSIDGGGIRGVFSIKVVARIEELFRQERGDPNLVLADVFDMFAGTSTGAIIATLLSWGESVQNIERMYVHDAAEMFSRERWFRRWRSKYRADFISRRFREYLCEDDAEKTPALLGSKRLRTILLMVMRNASTGATWPISNNPNGLFNDAARADCNLKIPLWRLLRASTAAPAFFPPEQIPLDEQNFLFVDGGVTPYANPALIALLMATLPQYRLGWPTGRDQLHLISVGTGYFRTRLPAKHAHRIHLMDHLRFVIPTLLGAISTEQDMTCRIMGDCIHGHSLDSEIGDLSCPTLFAPREQKFTYVRYNHDLDSPEIAQMTPLPTHMDNLRLIPLLQRIGREYASINVRSEHLWPRETMP